MASQGADDGRGAPQPAPPEGPHSAGLADLLARVEAAEGPDRQLDVDLWFDLAWEGQGDERIAPELSASIDATLALVERLLPGWTIELGAGGGSCWAVLKSPDYSEDEDGNWDTGDAFVSGGFLTPPPRTLPLSILAALLRALAARAEGPASPHRSGNTPGRHSK